MGENSALALTPVIIGVAIGASALTLLAFWAWEQRKDRRRQPFAIGAVAIGALLYGLWVWGALVAPRIVSFAHRTVVSERWTGPDLTIAVLAAPRLGPGGLSTEDLQRLITRINARDPELVIVAGELTASRLAQADMEERFAVTLSLGALARLEPDLGVVAVLGPEDAAYGRETLSRDLEDAGVALLWNRSVVVERAGQPFVVAGWAPAPETDPEAARDGAPEGAPIIAVAAEPGSTPGDHPAALTIVASTLCAGLLGCDRPIGVEGPFVGTAGLEGGGMTPPTVLFVTLRAENPS